MKSSWVKPRTQCVRTNLCFPQVFIFCSNSRKSGRDTTEECPEPEHDARRRSEGPASKGNRVLNGSRDSSSDPDDVTPKKVGRWPSEEPQSPPHGKAAVISATRISGSARRAADTLPRRAAPLQQLTHNLALKSALKIYKIRNILLLVAVKEGAGCVHGGALLISVRAGVARPQPDCSRDAAAGGTIRSLGFLPRGKLALLRRR